MTYVRSGGRRGGDRLGLFLIDDALAVTSAVKGISTITSFASNIFDPGKTRDAQRLARANFFRDAAKAGSITAARYLIGGTQYTAGNEIPYYNAAIADLRADNSPQGFGEQVWQAALMQGPKWADGIPDPGGTQQMVDDVKRDIAAIGAAAPGGAPTNFSNSTTSATAPRSSSGGVTLPTVHSTASFNYVPWLIGAGVGVAVLAMRKSS